jgi:hypothetical protein
MWNPAIRMQAGFVQIAAADAGGTQLGAGGQLVERANAGP